MPAVAAAVAVAAAAAGTGGCLCLQLADHLNAEVVAGTITTRQDALDYLTWTYFYRWGSTRSGRRQVPRLIIWMLLRCIKLMHASAHVHVAWEPQRSSE
jgi:hypothetical protein